MPLHRQSIKLLLYPSKAKSKAVHMVNCEFFVKLIKKDGEVVLSNASAQAIHKAQSAFSGAAEAMGISSEEDVQALVDEVRYGKER